MIKFTFALYSFIQPLLHILSNVFMLVPGFSDTLWKQVETQDNHPSSWPREVSFHLYSQGLRKMYRPIYNISLQTACHNLYWHHYFQKKIYWIYQCIKILLKSTYFQELNIIKWVIQSAMVTVIFKKPFDKQESDASVFCTMEQVFSIL